MPNREQAYDVARREGAKVLVGYFDPGLMTGTNPVSTGWHELGETHFYALPPHRDRTDGNGKHPSLNTHLTPFSLQCMD
jgi:hypothetical protein